MRPVFGTTRHRAPVIRARHGVEARRDAAHRRLAGVWIGGLWLIAGCASPPIDTGAGVESSTPDSLVAEAGDPAATIDAGARVLWGGLIIASANLESGSQLEVLAYPLDRVQRPQTTHEPQGRFIVRTRDYLETLDFSPGRPVTAYGRVAAIDDGRVGEADYRYPVLQVDELHLWRPGDEPVRPRFNFGIGIDLSN